MSVAAGSSPAPLALGPDGFPIKALKRKVYYKNDYSMELPARYDMKEVVGRGAYGVVISAHDSLTNKTVAIKKIGNMFADVVDGKRILRELKLLSFFSQPKHPNVLSLIDVFRSRRNTITCNSLALQFAEPGKPLPLPPINTNDFFADVYFVTDFVVTDLQKVIKTQVLSEDHARIFVYQMCSGLNFIHAGGIIHRDIKPSNMLVSDKCELQIADFGLARCEGSDNLTNYVVTRWYRPPELLLAAEVYTGKVDMWGIGCLAVEILTGQPLFPGNDYINQLVRITDAIGRPSEEDLKASVSSEEALAFMLTLPQTKDGFDVKENIRKLLPSSSEKDGEGEGEGEGEGDGVAAAAAGKTSPTSPAVAAENYDLFLAFVASLLQFNPDKRMSALQAMRHPWLAEFYLPEDEKILPKGKFTWAEESKDISLEELKTMTRETVDAATQEDWRSCE